MGTLLLVFWFFPLFLFTTMVMGFVRYVVTRHRYMGKSGATEAIIQVTTIGNYETVNEIIRGVRSYNLPFPYQFSVVAVSLNKKFQQSLVRTPLSLRSKGK